ncbi:MAG: hypothetical protein RL728_1107 [Bacteroidota bacterium]|jgi:hypothetical protein
MKKPNQKNLPVSKKISNIQKFLGKSDITDYIIWILSIPRYEWSDSMLKGYKMMIDNNQNEIWLANYFNENLKDEILDYVTWGKEQQS